MASSLRTKKLDRIKIRILKKALNRTLSVKDLGLARRILGMHIIRDRSKKESAVTGEVRDKGTSKVQHVGCQAGRVDTSSKLQAIRKTEPKDKGREVGNDEDIVCIRSRKPHVCNDVYTDRY